MEMKKKFAVLTAAAMLATATIPACLAEGGKGNHEHDHTPPAMAEEAAPTEAPAEATTEAPAEEATIDVTGNWTGNIFGVDATLTMNADHTFSVSVYGAEMATGTWTQTPVNVTLKSDELGMEVGFLTEENTMYNGDYDVSLTRAAAESTEVAQSGYTAPATVTAKEQAEFNGTYEVTRVGIDGDYMDFSEFLDEDGTVLGVTANSITIQDGMVSAMGMDNVMSFTFYEGRLTSMLLDTEIASIQKNEDGTILLTMMGLQFQAQPVKAETVPQA